MQFFMRVNKRDLILKTFQFHKLNAGKFTYTSTHVSKLKPVTPSVGPSNGSIKRCKHFGKQAAVCEVKHSPWPRLCAYTFVLEQGLYADFSRSVLIGEPRNTSCVHQLGSECAGILPSDEK